MSRKLPDVATLDSLILGAEDADALEDWQELLMAPDAAERWRDAVSRREHIDEFASAVIAHPWLARMLTGLRELQRTLTHREPGVLEAVLAPELMTHVLGPEARPTTRLATPRRGEVEMVRLAQGDIIELRPAPELAGDFRVFYRSALGEGRLPRRRWRMEAGEAPVLLLGISASDEESMEAALGNSVVLGGVILLEASRPRE
ncbi:hypothetical protein HPC49_14365 [Pyxidicoccus fallax]|uniref:Uncharacterized protein n=1 Tax=Pyxidicoccus fallax TaxID=394095 RepID=A0A848LK72_9BACT|nr:hypothetical protein [Pyxidicoccus fallax]NMO18121.1 hypothetical protein [Pyxidicoccus fallax]NPC79415.1 hypothetical protein [Pyxidicoccus fallax]